MGPVVRLLVQEGRRMQRSSSSAAIMATALAALLLGCGEPKPQDSGPQDSAHLACEPVTEIPYDGIDQDCDGLDLTDVDGDGADALEGEGGTDCDDEDPAVHPGATETCNGHDDDCDALVDDDDDRVEGQVSVHADQDGDGYGDPGDPQSFCEPPSGFVDDDSDCDDADPLVNPSASEECNGYDDDCDGLVDDEDDGVQGQTQWYADQDGDGFGGSEFSQVACEPPSGHVDNDTDCDDTNPEVHLLAGEVYDGIDNDCDGLVDCEDAGCLPLDECEERDCSDGLDSDHDGLVDCQDDDCWSVDCHPAGLRSRVHGGTMQQRSTGWYWHYTGWMAAPRWERTDFNFTHTAQLGSVWGTLQVLPSGAASWDATSARTTCTWSADTVSMSWYRDYGSGVYTVRFPNVVRGGFAVADGCRVAGSSFLPVEVHPAYGVGWVDNSWDWGFWNGGQAWYQPVVFTPGES